MAPERLREACDRFGQVFVQCYGLTECAGTATAMRRDELDPSRLASCGRAVVGTQVAVLDTAGHPVDSGEVGELCVRGRNVMLGYRNLPDQTAAALRGGWLHTGDLARCDDAGYLYVVDRMKDMIIRGELNIYAREVEDIIAAHPTVAGVAVIGVPDDRWGEAVHAVVQARPGHTVDTAALVRHVTQHKGVDYAPQSVETVEALPTTNVGKVDKQALRARHFG